MLKFEGGGNVSKSYRKVVKCAQLELWKGNRGSYVLGMGFVPLYTEDYYLSIK
jgi:hypothetical protein